MSHSDSKVSPLMVYIYPSCGLLVACSVITLWAVSLTYLLTVSIAELPIYRLVLAVVWQTFLYTGLFVTAHDAMHGVVFPQNRLINNFIGTLTALGYALFSFRELSEKHWQHHHYPASDRDPDFHDGKHLSFWAWYGQFIKGYWSWRRTWGFTGLFIVSYGLFHVSDFNLFLFWMLPAILSSLQLFYFGSFLPHREPVEGYSDRHRARTLHLPFFLSFLTCYHFGYHHEHHTYPHLPWWQLPSVYKRIS